MVSDKNLKVANTITVKFHFSPLVLVGIWHFGVQINETPYSKDLNRIAKDTNKFVINKLNLFSRFAYLHYFLLKKMEEKEAVDKASRSRVPGFNRKKNHVFSALFSRTFKLLIKIKVIKPACSPKLCL